MAVQIRLNGEPEEIAALLAALDSVVEMAGNGREYPNRSGFGVRVYVEGRLRARVRAPNGPVTRPPGAGNPEYPPVGPAK